MIEFKGECGHTIRARDEDAGKTVRCSYCGKESQVVVKPAEGFDGLLDEVERTGELDPEATKAERRRHRAQMRAQRRMAGARDPFDIIRKMIWVAAGIIVIILASTKGVEIIRSLPDPRDRGEPRADADNTPSPRQEAPAPTVQPAPTGLGLLTTRLDPLAQGVYVTSAPAAADIYHLADWDRSSPILDAPDADQGIKTNASLRLEPGKRVIAIAVRVNSPELMRYPEYEELRRRIESNSLGRETLGNYFLPDESIDTRVEKRRGAQFIVRVYTLEIASREWRQVTALFLPRVSVTEANEYLTVGNHYGFDRSEVVRELSHYRVPAEDHEPLMEALRRMGAMTYFVEQDSAYRVFRIDLVDGFLTSAALSR